MSKPTLTIRYWPNAWPSDVAGELLDEDGESLWGHVSSNKSWLEADLLRNFTRGNDLAERYPEGFEVRWEEVQ